MSLAQQTEYFQTSGKGVSLTSNSRITKSGSTGWENTSYGSILIDSIKNDNIYEWIFKITRCDNYTGMVIGITSNHSTINNAFSRDKTSSNYGVLSYNGQKVSRHQYKKYGKQFKQNDTLKMILNLKSKTLSFKINNIDQGIAYNNIAIGNNIKYKLAITLGAKDNSITLTGFKVIKSNNKQNQMNILKQQVIELQNTINILQNVNAQQNSGMKEKQQQFMKALADVAALKQQNKALKDDVDRLQHENKEMETELIQLKKENKALKKEKQKLIDRSNYMEWDHNEILQWIFSLDNGIYKQYEDKLRQSLSVEQLKGSNLSIVNIEDIRNWGVTNFILKKQLLKHIKELMYNQKEGPAKDQQTALI